MAHILVTGGSGFVGGAAIVELLRQGHSVRTTVRDISKETVVRQRIASAVDADDRLTVVAADLTADAGWTAAVDGIEVVHHVASPLTATRVEAEVVRPAVDGVLRVLRAARDAGVRRVVATSSCGAVYYGHPERETPFDENDWTDIDGGPMSNYVKSKALSERAAWDFIDTEGGDLELTTVCPTGIFGPALDADSASSLDLVRRLLAGMPAAPNLWFGVVDVRDVVDLHLRAMNNPAAAHQRYIASTDDVVSMLDIARVLRERLGDDARKVPTRRFPDWAVRLAGRFNTEIGDLVPLLGQRRRATGAKARRELGWNPRPWEDAIAASGESLVAVTRRAVPNATS